MKYFGFYFTVILVWLSVALAVSAGLYFTRDIKCLWFMILPLFFGMRMKDSDDEEKEEKNETRDGKAGSL